MRKGGVQEAPFLKHKQSVNMPPKTRKKSSRGTDKNVESGSASSSDEKKSTKTPEVITRLSQKYLNTGRRSTRSSNKSSQDQENGYDGDEENTTGSPSSVSSPYDFEDEAMSEDSTKVTKEKKTKKNVKKTKNEKKAEKQSKQSKTSPKTSPPQKQNKSVRFSGTTDSFEKETTKLPKTPIPKTTCKTKTSALEPIDVQMVESSQRQLRKRKVDTPEPITSNSKVTKKDTQEKVKSDPKIKVTKTNTSIDMLSVTRKIVPEMVQNSSTPNEIVRTKALRKSGNDSCFGFDERKQTSLLMSPVHRVPITPMSDYASMDTFSHDVSMEESVQKSKAPSPTLFSMEEDDFNELQVNKSTSRSYSKTKKRQQTRKQQVTKSNEWAEKMINEIKEIESFELSIEQD